MSQTTVELTLPPTVYSPLEALFSRYAEDVAGIERIATFVANNDSLFPFFMDGNRKHSGIGRFTAKELFAKEGAISSLNASYWSKVIALTDVLEVMPAPKRNEWHKMISDNETPAFEREIVILTVESLLLNRNQYFAEKVDSIFRALSHEHVTNSPMGFSKRMIVAYMIDGYGHLNMRQCEYINDLRETVARLLGREFPKRTSTYRDISRLETRHVPPFGEWIDFDGGAVRLKLFKKGTAHLEVHPDVAWRLNQVLASLYPMAIPSECRTKPAAKPKEHVLYDNMLPASIIEILESCIDSWSRSNKDSVVVTKPMTKDIESRFGELMTLAGGIRTESRLPTWNFDYDPWSVVIEMVRLGCVPDRVSHQFHPTPLPLAQELVDLAYIQDGHRVLEPSAGTGAIATILPADAVCVEISAVHAVILKARGHEVINGDFLAYKPELPFDRIVMNPPFSDGRALAHVKHAASMLAQNGRLVAILPASLHGKDLVPGMTHDWQAPRDGGFENTKVRVAVLVLTY